MTPHEIVLRDGRRVYLRDLRAGDRAMYERAIMALSPHSRYLRFAAPMPRVSKSLLDRLMQFDSVLQVVHAALTCDGRRIVGVVRLVRAERGDSGEVAIGIADEWQESGLGSALLRSIVGHARTAGLDSLTATTLSENRLAVRLLRASGFSPAGRNGAQSEWRLRLDGPDVRSMPPQVRPARTRRGPADAGSPRPVLRRRSGAAEPGDALDLCRCAQPASVSRSRSPG